MQTVSTEERTKSAFPWQTRSQTELVIMSDKIVFAIEEPASAQASLNSGSDGSQVPGSRHATNFATERLAARAYQVEANNPK